MWRKTVNSAIGTYGDESRAFATGWAVLRRNGWNKIEGKWTQVEKGLNTEDSVEPIVDDSVTITKDFEFKIEKANVEKQIAFGFAMISKDKNGNEICDLQNDCIDQEELENLAYKYVEFYREAGSEHNSRGKGVLIESVVMTPEKASIWGVPIGFLPQCAWWIGIHVTDKIVWEKVKSGEYKAFSIEGSAVRVEV